MEYRSQKNICQSHLGTPSTWINDSGTELEIFYNHTAETVAVKTSIHSQNKVLAANPGCGWFGERKMPWV